MSCKPEAAHATSPALSAAQLRSQAHMHATYSLWPCFQKSSFVPPSCSNNKGFFVPLAVKRMMLHRHFWASISAGKVGPALRLRAQTSGMSVLVPSQNLATLSRLLSQQIYLNFSYRVVGLGLWILCGWRAWGWRFGQVGRGAPSITCPWGTTGGRSFCSGWAGSMCSSR